VALPLSVSLLLSAGVSFADPTAEEKAAARALATQGAEALKLNHYAEALDLVTRAEALVDAPTHLLMIARAQTGLGKLVAAQETYLRLLHVELRADAPGAFKKAQVDAKDELAAIEPKIASLRIVVDGAAQKKATVKLDDVIVPTVLLNVFRPVDPGPHVIAVYPVGLSPVKGSVDLQPGERKDFKLAVPDGPAPSGVPLSPTDNPDAVKSGDTTPQPQPQPQPDSGSGGFFSPLRGAGIGVGIVGVAGVAVGAFFVAKGFSDQNAGNALCGTSSACPIAFKAQILADDQDAVNNKNIGVAVLAVGGAALVGGVTMIIVGKPRPRAAATASSRGAPWSSVSMAPWFAGTSGGVLGKF
jgi:hypothetical protein